MGNLTTTPASMNDNGLQFGAVTGRVLPGDADLIDRVRMESEFEVSLPGIGEVRRDHAKRMLVGHPALDPGEDTTLGVLLKKIHDYDAANSKWAQGE